VRILPFLLPTQSPWLNPIEPKWVHGKRNVVEYEGLLTAQQLAERICAYFGCSYEPHLGDVAGDGGGANNRTALVLDRGYGHRDHEEGAVLAHALRDVVGHALATANARHDLIELPLAVGREEPGHGLADHFLCRVVGALGGAIPAGDDDADEVLAENGIVGGLDDGRQHPQALLDRLSLGDLDLEGMRLLLQQGKGALPPLFRELGVALGEQDPGVLVADVDELRLARMPAKCLHQIGAEERESLEPPLLVPQVFQADSPRTGPLGPQEGHHFPKDAHVAVGAGRLLDERIDRRAEASWFWLSPTRKRARVAAASRGT
jgi:hypothetical protein